jgi:transposase
MKGSIGVSGSITHIIPRKVYSFSGKLSKDAKQRLKVIDWYNNTSSKYTTTGKKSVVLTCRHFGISRSCFYKWKNRFNPNCLSSLENRHKQRKPYDLRVKHGQRLIEFDMKYLV